MDRRWVFDTNVLVSALLFESSTPGRALSLASRGETLLFSELTWTELHEVLLRPKFDRYVTRQTRQSFLDRLARLSEPVLVADRIAASRDPNDDKFLEVAVSGRADALVTGDADLLALHPFRGIPIHTPADFLAEPDA